MRVLMRNIKNSNLKKSKFVAMSFILFSIFEIAPANAVGNDFPDSIWASAKINNKVITNYDVRTYIKNHLLTDVVRENLLNKSADQAAYTKIVEEFVDFNFDNTLRDLFWQEIFQQAASRPGTDYPVWDMKVISAKYDKAMEEQTSTISAKKQAEMKLSIAKLAFPFKTDISKDDIRDAWNDYKLREKSRLIETFRKQWVSGYTRKITKLYSRPETKDIRSLYRSYKNKYDVKMKEFGVSTMLEDVKSFDYFNQDPLWRTFLKFPKINRSRFVILTPPLKKYEKDQAKVSKVLAPFVKNIFSSESHMNLKFYIRQTTSMMKKFSVEQLEEKVASASKKYQKTKDSKFLLNTYFYQAAIELKGSDFSSKQMIEDSFTLTENAFKSTKVYLSKVESLFSNEENLSLPIHEVMLNYFFKNLKESFEVTKKSRSYTNEQKKIVDTFLSFSNAYVTTLVHDQVQALNWDILTPYLESNTDFLTNENGPYRLSSDYKKSVAEMLKKYPNEVIEFKNKAIDVSLSPELERLALSSLSDGSKKGANMDINIIDYHGFPAISVYYMKSHVREQFVKFTDFDLQKTLKIVIKNRKFNEKLNSLKKHYTKKFNTEIRFRVDSEFQSGQSLAKLLDSSVTK